MVIQPEVGGVQERTSRIVGFRTIPLSLKPIPNFFAICATNLPYSKKTLAHG
jgi:hypothetical protein